MNSGLVIFHVWREIMVAHSRKFSLAQRLLNLRRILRRKDEFDESVRNMKDCFSESKGRLFVLTDRQGVIS
jgi:hypothetical protein